MIWRRGTRAPLVRRRSDPPVYLVDTNILSIGAPGSREAPTGWIPWMEAHSEALFLSTITVAEVCDGIAKVKRSGAPGRATRLSDWLDLILHLYSDRVLPFDVAAARVAGRLLDRASASGHAPGFADIAIAATAESREFTVLTRNARDFAPLGALVVNPFEILPA